MSAIAVVKDLEDQGFLLKIEDHRHAIGHCQRCDTLWSPHLNPVVREMKPLAELPSKGIDGQIRFIPSALPEYIKLDGKYPGLVHFPAIGWGTGFRSGIARSAAKYLQPH